MPRNRSARIVVALLLSLFTVMLLAGQAVSQEERCDDDGFSAYSYTATYNGGTNITTINFTFYNTSPAYKTNPANSDFVDLYNIDVFGITMAQPPTTTAPGWDVQNKRFITTSNPDWKGGIKPGQSLSGFTCYAVGNLNVLSGMTVAIKYKGVTDWSGNSSTPGSIGGWDCSLLLQPLPCLKVTKTVNYTEAVIGQKVTYTYKICNCGPAAVITAVTEDITNGLGGHIVTPWLEVFKTANVEQNLMPPGLEDQLNPRKCVTLTHEYIVPDNYPVTSDLTNCLSVDWRVGSSPQIFKQDCKTVDIKKVDICITKVPDPASGYEGDTVTYHYTVTNCGEVPLKVTSINDDKTGDLLSQFTTANQTKYGRTDTINPGDSVSFTQATPYILPAGPATVHNTVTINAQYTDPGNTVHSVQNSAQADVTVLAPQPRCVSITKTVADKDGGSGPAYVGEPITYTYKVCNCTSEGTKPSSDITITSISDVVSGHAAVELKDAFKAANPNGNYILHQGECVTFSRNYTTVAADVGTLTNTVTASIAEGPSDSSSASIEVLQLAPCLNVEKTVDHTTAIQGERLTYTYKICNCSNATATITGVTDSVVGGLLSEFKAANVTQNGKTAGVNDDQLNKDQCVTFTKVYDVPSNYPVNTDLKNCVTVGWKLRGTQQTDTKLVCATVKILEPKICITKTVVTQEPIYPGAVVTYHFVVENCGTADLMVTSLSDDKMGDLLGAFKSANEGKSVLAAGQKVQFNATYTVPSNASGQITNTVCVDASYYDSVDINPYSYSLPQKCTSATIIVLPPPERCVSIEKTATKPNGDPGPVFAGDPVLYTYKVCNCTPEGTMPGTDITITSISDVVNGYPAVELKDAFAAANSGSYVLAPGQCVTFSRQYVTQIADVGTLTNTVTASIAEGPSDSATASIVVQELNACLDVVKKVNHKTAIPGETIGYKYVICNCGNATATITAITDTLISGLLSQFQAANVAQNNKTPGVNDNQLEPNECVILEPAYTIPSTYPVDTNLQNCVTVSWSVNGKKQPITKPVCATVRIVKPDICITKTPSPMSGYVGDQITYTYTITNCGETTLNVTNISDTNTSLGDLLAAFIAANQLKYKQTTILQPGQFVQFNAPNKFTIPQGASGQITNTACVYADYVDPVPVNEYNYSLPEKCTTATVTVITPEQQPCIDITKTAPESAQVNDTISYKYTVCNCGDVVLAVNSLVDTNPLIGSLFNQFKQANKQQNHKTDANSNILNPDECVTITVPYTIKLSDLNPLQNCATVTASIPIGTRQTISDTACATVNIVTPQTKVCFLPVTFTQQGWHDYCASAPGVPGGMIYSKFPIAFARFGFYGSTLFNQVAIGAPNGKITAGSHMVTFVGKTSGLNQLCNFLPQTGPCDRLWASYTSPSYLLTKSGAKTSNVLAGETLALTLNIAYNDMRLMPRSPGYDLENFTLTQGILKGKTVGQVLNIANSVLAGAPPSNFGFTGTFAQGCSALVGVLQRINANYEFVDINTFIDRGYLKPNRVLGQPTAAHSMVLMF